MARLSIQEYLAKMEQALHSSEHAVASPQTKDYGIVLVHLLAFIPGSTWMVRDSVKKDDDLLHELFDLLDARQIYQRVVHFEAFVERRHNREQIQRCNFAWRRIGYEDVLWTYMYSFLISPLQQRRAHRTA